VWDTHNRPLRRRCACALDTERRTGVVHDLVLETEIVVALDHPSLTTQGIYVSDVRMSHIKRWLHSEGERLFLPEPAELSKVESVTKEDGEMGPLTFSDLLDDVNGTLIVEGVKLSGIEITPEAVLDVGNDECCFPLSDEGTLSGLRAGWHPDNDRSGLLCVCPTDSALRTNVRAAVRRWASGARAWIVGFDDGMHPRRS
jgi:hypothetical protein